MYVKNIRIVRQYLHKKRMVKIGSITNQLRCFGLLNSKLLLVQSNLNKPQVTPKTPRAWLRQLDSNTSGKNRCWSCETLRNPTTTTTTKLIILIIIIITTIRRPTTRQTTAGPKTNKKNTANNNNKNREKVEPSLLVKQRSWSSNYNDLL